MATKGRDPADGEAPRGAAKKAGGAKKAASPKVGRGKAKPGPEKGGSGSGGGEGTSKTRKPAGESDLLDLARTVIGLAGTEISNRRVAVEDRMERSQTVLRRAQQDAGADDRRILEEVLDRLARDRDDTLQAVDAKAIVLDDLSHDLAAVTARFKEVAARGPRAAEADESETS